MIKRAVILITDQSSIKWRGWNDPVFQTQGVEASEKLLADLHTLASECGASDIPHLRNAAAHVREWLPKEDEDA